MSDCEINCPYCGNNFDEPNIDKVGALIVMCTFCEQTFEVVIETALFAKVVPKSGAEFDKKKAIAEAKKGEYFIILCGKKNWGNNMFISTTNEIKGFLDMMLYLNKAEALRIAKNYSSMLPKAKVMTYKDYIEFYSKKDKKV